MSKDPRRVAIGRIGGLKRASQYDGLTVTADARQAADQRFRDQAEREAIERCEQLTDKELDRRAAALRKLHFARMACESAKARASKKRPSRDLRSATVLEEVARVSGATSTAS